MRTLVYFKNAKYLRRLLGPEYSKDRFQKASRMSHRILPPYSKRVSCQTSQVFSHIWDAKCLASQISIEVHPNFFPQADGQMTDRELASGLNQRLLWVTQSSTPYLCRELIRWLNRRFQAFQVFFSKYLPGIPSKPMRLIAVKERRVLVQPITPPASPDQQTISVTPSVKRNKSQLITPSIAYVSLSKLDGQIMGKVLGHLGCDFILITNPMYALPCLLNHKPNMIFLDLPLSLTTGHELCSQIRRISIFSDTPVIILTNRDNLLDQMRAKVVGSTDFLAKPIGLENVQAILLQHLSAQRFFFFKSHN